MTNLAHVRSGKIIRRFSGESGWVDLANGGRVSPPVAGFVSGKDRVVPVVDETRDDSTGGRTISAMTETIEKGRVLRLTVISDRPAPPEPTLAERQTRDLTRPEFTYLLAYTGLDDVWAAIEAAAKKGNRALYATLRSQAVQQNFRLSVTLDFIAQVAEIAAQVVPDVDLSEDAIRTAWAGVADKGGPQ